MMPQPIIGAPAGAVSGAGLPTARREAATPGELGKAAQQFEAIFVRQMLAAARKTDFAGEDKLFGGQGLDTFRQMQDERFAQIAAERGMLGIGRLLEARLSSPDVKE